MVVTAVNIALDANISTVLERLYSAVNKCHPAYPSGANIIAGDFNQTYLKTKLR